MMEFIKDCLRLNLGDYENIGIDLEINKLILIIMLAFSIGTVILSLYRGNIRLVIMQLIRHAALDEDSAKTLGQIGLKNSKIIKWMLKGDNLLTKIVRRRGEVRYSYEEYMEMKKAKKLNKVKFNVDEESFYIDPDKRERADTIVEKYESSIQHTALSILFVIAIGICIILVMPGLLNVINSLLKSIKM